MPVVDQFGPDKLREGARLGARPLLPGAGLVTSVPIIGKDIPMADVKKAPSDGTYRFPDQKGIYQIMAGDPLPDGAEFEARAEKAAPENRAEKAAPENRAAAAPDKK